MTALTKKNDKFIWGSELRENFEKLKQALISAPVLAIPSGQGDSDAHDRVIGYASRNLKVHEKSYPTYDLELPTKELNMRQRRWLELIKVYECEIIYHPRKVNVVAVSLSRKNEVIVQLIRAGQSFDEQLQYWRLSDKSKGLRLYYVEDDTVRYCDQLWVSIRNSLREYIMKESHSTPYSIHLVKVEYQRPAGKLKPLPITELK
ncbi:uncharacterized protein LOC142505038 [Primulina tabacum]|uniref:uncharacterized protein LOC142505038 n=1 Tax=Primulina tabacum TaxID=48773 RepID=UPI003F59707B